MYEVLRTCHHRRLLLALGQWIGSIGTLPCCDGWRSKAHRMFSNAVIPSQSIQPKDEPKLIPAAGMPNAGSASLPVLLGLAV